MRRTMYALVSLIVVFGLVQCGGGNGDDNPTDPDSDPPPDGSGDIVDVTIRDDPGFAFVDPDGNVNQNATVTIELGQTVRWTYDDTGYEDGGGAQHTVESGEGVGGDDGDGVPEGGTAIGSPVLTPGDNFSFTPNAVGTWTYYCTIHPNIMYEATIIVTEG